MGKYASRFERLMIGNVNIMVSDATGHKNPEVTATLRHRDTQKHMHVSFPRFSAKSRGKYYGRLYKRIIAEWITLSSADEIRDELAKRSRCEKCNRCFPCAIKNYLDEKVELEVGYVQKVAYIKVTQRMEEAKKATGGSVYGGIVTGNTIKYRPSPQEILHCVH